MINVGMHVIVYITDMRINTYFIICLIIEHLITIKHASSLPLTQVVAIYYWIYGRQYYTGTSLPPRQLCTGTILPPGSIVLGAVMFLYTGVRLTPINPIIVWLW